MAHVITNKNIPQTFRIKNVYFKGSSIYGDVKTRVGRFYVFTELKNPTYDGEFIYDQNGIYMIESEERYAPLKMATQKWMSQQTQ